MIDEFQNPLDKYRPLQLIPSFEQWFGEDAETLRTNLRRVRDLGIGGLVVAVNHQNYLRSEKAWEILKLGLQISKELGFRLWFYDEEGYPSGAAGGLVLEKDPSLEATGLIQKFDGTGKPAYEVIQLYQDTHATENFYQKRRYVNILDPKATTTFIEVTHEEYARRLGELRQWFDAVFTDEPSLISAYVPKGKKYPPTLPWVRSLPEIFMRRKGYDLMPHIESLYRDTGEEDRKIRCDFYDLLSQLCAENYFGQIQAWCQKHGIASSGHLLGEETLVWQTYFEGNPFPCYRKMDVPGIDMILSSPERIMGENFFLVPKLASSAAHLTGKREVMCEISDFLGEVENRPATFEQILCTASILYALGVTELVCMYGSPVLDVLGRRDGFATPQPTMLAKEYKRYTKFVARLKSTFAAGKIESSVAVLHPIVSVWANFTPSDRSMYEPHPNEQVRFIDEGFTNLCRALLQHQIDFDILDDDAVAEAEVSNGELRICDRRYSLLLLPPMDTIRLTTVEKIAHFAEMGGSVIGHVLLPKYAAEGPKSDGKIVASVRGIFQQRRTVIGRTTEELAKAVRDSVQANCRLDPPTLNILCTKVSLDDASIYFLVNTSSRPWAGECSFAGMGQVTLLDPEWGQWEAVETEAIANSGVRLKLRLEGYESVFVQFSMGR